MMTCFTSQNLIIFLPKTSAFNVDYIHIIKRQKKPTHILFLKKDSPKDNPCIHLGAYGFLIILFSKQPGALAAYPFYSVHV